MASALELAFLIKVVDEATDKLKGVAGGLEKLGGFGKAAGAVVAGGVAIAGAAIVGLGKGLADCVEEAMNAQTVQAQLNAVLQSTGGIAGVTADDVNKLASQWQNVSTFEDDAIVSGETVLLQFTSIGKDVFPQATEAMLNLATRMGTDLPSAATMLGKALETPGEGLLRLKAAGVAFDDAQVKMIQDMAAAGDTAGAQKMILDALQVSLGGAAVAAGDTFAGKMEIMKNKMADVKESIGTAMLPGLTMLADKLLEVFNDPVVQEAINKVVTWIGENLPIAIEAVVKWFEEDLPVAIATAKEWLLKMGAWIEEQRQKWLTFRDNVVTAWTNIQNAIQTAKDNIQKFVTPIIEWFQSVGNAIQNAVEWVQNLIEKIQALADQYLPDWLVGHSPPPMATWLTQIAGAAGAASAGFDAMGESVSSVHHHYNLTIQSAAQAEQVGADFGLMMAMAGV